MPVKPSPFTPLDDAIIVQMYRSGNSYTKISRAIHKSDKRVRLRMEKLETDGRLVLRRREARTEDTTCRNWRAPVNTGRNKPANADDHKPLILGIKTDPVWSFSCAVAREAGE